MNEEILLATGFRMLLKFLGIGVLIVAILAWFISWLKDKIA
jgi:hypothetical protein